MQTLHFKIYLGASSWDWQSSSITLLVMVTLLRQCKTLYIMTNFEILVQQLIVLAIEIYYIYSRKLPSIIRVLKLKILLSF